MSGSRKRSWWGFVFVAPWVVGFTALTAVPMAWSLYLSFCHYDLASVTFIGADNYRRLAHDPEYWVSLLNTSLYALLSVPLGLSGSLLLAVLLNQKLAGKGVLRAMFYIPTLVPMAASSYLWKYVLARDYGLLNAAVRKAGLPGPDWLGSSRWALPSLVLMSLWGIGGGRMIIFLAGLQGISKSLYEAASIDGASRLRQFWHVTVPMLTPMIFFNAVLGVIAAFQVFTQAFLMTGGGPNDATLFTALYLFRQAFTQLHMGYASAVAWTLFVILAALTAVQFATAKRWVHYEAEAV